VGDLLSADPTRGRASQSFAFESFDVRVRVTVDNPEVLEQVRSLLPPHARPCPVEDASESFGILTDDNGSYRFERGDSPVSRGLDLRFALLLMEAQLRIYVGLHTPGKIFVHAGAVEYGGTALVIPGMSFAGKTMLATALVQAGAAYLSDEYAVIDEAGLVHPFAKPLSIRDSEQVQNDHEVEALGGRIAAEPVPIGVVVFTEYRTGAQWQPRELTLARATLGMLQHTLPALKRHEEALRVLRTAIEGAVLLEGERGEAAEVAPRLLDLVTR
jgi:hypothetical protein